MIHLSTFHRVSDGSKIGRLSSDTPIVLSKLFSAVNWSLVLDPMTGVTQWSLQSTCTVGNLSLACPATDVGEKKSEH